MNIRHKLITFCSVFAVLGSTVAFARPIMRSEDGYLSYEKKADGCHVPTSKACAATGYEHCRFPNTTKDGWPAGMLLGNADLMLSLWHRLNA